MKTIADHILDISSNSVAAGATKVTLDIDEDTARGTFSFVVADNGRGIAPDVQERVFDPFFTTRPHDIRRFGLGLPFLRANAELTGGGVTLESTPGVGTTVTVIFHTDNIDCLPLGDIASTLFTLVVSDPHVFWDIRRRYDKSAYTVATEDLLTVFSIDELTDPKAQKLLLEYLCDQEKAVRVCAGQ